MRSSRRPARSVALRCRPMERNRVAWTMLHGLRIAPTEPAWKRARSQAVRRRSRPRG